MPDRKSAITTKPSRVRTTSTLSSPTSVTSARSRSSSRSPVRYVTDETLGKDEPINTASSNPDSPFHATTDEEEEEEQQQLIDTAKEVTKKNVGGNNKRRASTAPSQPSKRPRKASTSPPSTKMPIVKKEEPIDNIKEEEIDEVIADEYDSFVQEEHKVHLHFVLRFSYLFQCMYNIFFSIISAIPIHLRIRS